MPYEKPNHEDYDQPTFTEPVPDVYAECSRVLAAWRAKRRPWPAGMPAELAEAARWWVDTMQEPYDHASERPRRVAVSGQIGGSRIEAPYANRVKNTLRTFLRLPESCQRIVCAARQDEIWWRGEHEHRVEVENGVVSFVWSFTDILREYERQKELGSAKYRVEAIRRMKAMPVGKRLPYDKRKMDKT